MDPEDSGQGNADSFGDADLGSAVSASAVTWTGRLAWVGHSHTIHAPNSKHVTSITPEGMLLRS